jgi:hypothetical protein
MFAVERTPNIKHQSAGDFRYRSSIENHIRRQYMTSVLPEGALFCEDCDLSERSGAPQGRDLRYATTGGE